MRCIIRNASCFENAFIVVVVVVMVPALTTMTAVSAFSTKQPTTRTSTTRQIVLQKGSSRSNPSALSAAADKPPPTKSTSSRQNRIAALQEWASGSAVGIKVAAAPGGKQLVALQSSGASGLGWFAADAKTALESGAVILSVPSAIALTVECPGDGPDDGSVASTVVPNAKLASSELFPWYVQMAVYLYKLDQVDASKNQKGGVNYRPWLDSLPRKFDTPLHWQTKTALEDLQYDYMASAVERQREQWKRHYDNLKLPANSKMSFDDFVWGCECARSRAFSGTYTGGAFNPATYAFTLLLVTAYVGLGLGTLEQAANGAGVVFAASILKDFVIPKFFKKKRYVICPMIDMANHKSTGTAGDVSFEFFGNAYSLAISAGASVAPGQELYISYGARSNDQLLQYYGFVETDNPHDVYVMPALRTWDISALETACGRQFAPGRLQKLDRAGLLGNISSGSTATAKDDNDGNNNDEAANVGGGVVLNRIVGMDPAVLQALRALVSTDTEWEAAGQAIGNFCEENSGGAANESCARLAARTAVEMELASKATTIEQDVELLKRMDTMKSLDFSSPEERLAIQFRIEKKKLLRETIEMLK